LNNNRVDCQDNDNDDDDDDDDALEVWMIIMIIQL